MPTNVELEKELKMLEGKMDSRMSAVEERLGSLENRVESKCEEDKQRFSSIDKKLDEMKLMIRSIPGVAGGQGLQTEATRTETQRNRVKNVRNREEVAMRNPNPFLIPKLDFPYFNGGDPVGWVRKAQKFFHFHPVENDTGFAEALEGSRCTN